LGGVCVRSSRKEERQETGGKGTGEGPELRGWEDRENLGKKPSRKGATGRYAHDSNRTGLQSPSKKEDLPGKNKVALLARGEGENSHNVAIIEVNRPLSLRASREGEPRLPPTSWQTRKHRPRVMLRKVDLFVIITYGGGRVSSSNR